MKIVLDAGNGLSGTYIPPMLTSLGIEVNCIYCESDGTFPNHLPNPEVPEFMEDLRNDVIRLNADLGLAFDGDADRCGIVDNLGNIIPGDYLVGILAKDLLSRIPNAPIVLDAKTSQVIFDQVKAWGGQPVMWKTGHSLTIAKMREISAPFGGDVHGHIFLGEDYYGYDDAPLAALKILEVIANSGKSSSEVFGEIPRFVTSSEIILPTPDIHKFLIVDEIKDIVQEQYEVIDIDGARTLFEHGWGIVRASNSQPAITLRFEAVDVEYLKTYMEFFRNLLIRYSVVDINNLKTEIDGLGVS